MVGKICPNMDFNPITIRHWRVCRDKLAINKLSLQQTNALDRFVNNALNTLFLLLVAFSQISSIICKRCCEQ